MNKKYIFSIAIFYLLTGIAAIAQPKLSFDKKVHDFGTILWNNPVTAEFKIVNKGDKPLVISNVTTSCGCTAAGWTKQPIAPGETGFVKSTFDAKAIGRFHKTVGIYCNAEPAPVYLAIEGTVGYEAKNYKTTHPFMVGSIGLDRNNVEFPDANRGDILEAEIGVVNTSDQTYTPVLMHLPHYLKAEAIPAKLPKDRAGKIKLTLDTKKLVNLGLTQTAVYLARFSGDKVGEENEITVSAVLLPDFSGMTEQQKSAAPVLHLSATELNMGEIGPKEKATQTIIVANTGKSDLVIRELQVFNSSVNVSLKKKYIKPGASTKLKVTLYGKGLKKLKSSPRVLMITNDPANAKVVIKLKATPKP